MKIGIVGLGLIGASIALSLKDKVDLIIGLDKDEEVLKIAIDRKIINKGGTEAKAILSDVDVVILALYPKAIIDFTIKNKDFRQKNQLFFDVASLKAKVIEEIQRELKEGEFIGAHPTSEREIKGIEGAREKLFRQQFHHHFN